MSNSNNDMRASNEWATRPLDQRYLNLNDLHRAVSDRRNISRVEGIALDHLQVRATDAGEIALASEAGDLGTLNNWSFGQLSQRAHAPAGYLRSLPADLATINLQWGLEMADDVDGKILVRGGDAGNRVASVNSETYGRIWDADVTGALIERIDPETWKVPGASYASSDPKRATTLYASDRDVFVFLVDETHPIEVDGETLFKGFYAWNSEVGSSTFGIATFLYRYVCDNRIIWGQRDYREIKIRHTSGGPHRFMYSARPMLQAYVNSGTAETVATVRAARSKEIGRDKASVTAWLKGRGFTQTQSVAAYASAERDGLNPRSLWGVVQGLTDVAHDIGHTDDRVELESKAGGLLDLVAA